MSTIKRYQPDFVDVTEEPNGEYVLFSDHEAAMGKLRKVLQDICDNNHTAEDARDALLDTQEMLKAVGIVPTQGT